MLKAQANNKQANKMQANLEESRPPRHNKGPWSQTEDAQLVRLVASQGAHSWVKISSFLQVRTAKQCRERYHQNLKHSLSHNPISPEEGEIIERLVNEIGKKWAEIARRLPGRSDNSVKNWWNGGMNRRRRMVVRREQLHGKPGNSESTFDESVETPSYARPAPLPTQPIIVPRSHQRLDPPLTSPAHSEVSMADSMGDAPSLTSDSSSSRFSMHSPHANPQSHQHHSLSLPRPGPLCWGPSPVLQGQSFQESVPATTAYDRSPSDWSHSEILKIPYDLPPANQRLHHFADVATARPPIGSSFSAQYRPQLANESPWNQIPPLGATMRNAHDYQRQPVPPPFVQLSTGASGVRQPLLPAIHDYSRNQVSATDEFAAPARRNSPLAPIHAFLDHTSTNLTSSSSTVPETSPSARSTSRKQAAAELLQPENKSMHLGSILN